MQTVRKQSDGVSGVLVSTEPRRHGDDPSIIGWNDIEVSPFCTATEADQAALRALEDEIIDRLFVLNEIRAKEEKQQGKKPGRQESDSKKAPARLTPYVFGGHFFAACLMLNTAAGSIARADSNLDSNLLALWPHGHCPAFQVPTERRLP